MQVQQSLYTPEQYLKLEEQAESKSEYRNGEIFPMTGGTTNHNTLALNMALFLKLALKGQPYKIFMNDLRLWIDRDRIYTYPDVMVIRDRPMYHGEGTAIVTNPLAIFEVLSKSTRNYDLGEKFGYYRTLDSLQEYILIEQSRYQVLQYVKVDKTWVLTEYETPSDILHFQSIPCKISLSELYEEVDFCIGEIGT
ncbi:Uma2 family endonuclease [Pseudanabaena sp. PCC 6802]|uniref:Uma2 family endonuclease n=1 Tax=Pseudanabaena sp. PCC 6802 TaxID=118173 RepID=UPI00034D5266|nr:Uma2 family endonuclease [Pseudanabaena sp. PCC 6802]